MNFSISLLKYLIFWLVRVNFNRFRGHIKDISVFYRSFYVVASELIATMS